MTSHEFGLLILFLFLLLGAARLLGSLFVWLRQPRVVGEILAGVLLGPSLVGHFAPGLSRMFPSAGSSHIGGDAAILAFLYNFGLLLLMFASGAETKSLFTRHDRREVSLLGLLGTGLPFILALCVVPFLPLGMLAGRVHARTPLLLVVSIAVAVTSIPVISKILHDLQILHTRFARLVLGVAVLEDILLWAVLAIATALAQSGAVPQRTIEIHIAATVVYFGAGLLLAPRALSWLTHASWNGLARTSPIAYVVLVLFAYSAIAALMDISLVFAAFLAGYGIVSQRELVGDALSSVSGFSFAVFIPIYFAVVGYKLDLGKTFSLSMLLIFFFASSAVKLFSAMLGAKAAGFDSRSSLNLAATLNARGGPGIVLASVAFDAGIINAPFYTTLVLVAILTSQAAGAWLEHLLHRGYPLLTGEPVEPLPVAPLPQREVAG